MIILGIESSCDETSIGILKDGVLLANEIASQHDIHSLYGGVVPELASRAHVECIDRLFLSALDTGGITAEEIDYIGVTTHPGLKGALLAGTAFAYGLGLRLDIPVYPVNHLFAHIAVNFLDRDVDLPGLGLVISGGHTTLFYVKSPVEFKVVGRTLDDACGETFDKVGRMLGLPFPGGPHIEKTAREGNPDSIRFPVPLLSKNSLDFSFSGLKTALRYHIESSRPSDKPDICASFQKTVGMILIEKASRAIDRYPVKSFFLGGGVVQNSYLRSEFEKLADRRRINLHIPDKRLCLDNGAMAAVMAQFLISRGKKPTSRRIEVL